MLIGLANEMHRWMRVGVARTTNALAVQVGDAWIVGNWRTRVNTCWEVQN